MATRSKKPVGFERSSGNVFADLGLPNPEQELLKARLTLQIYRLIKERGLTQARAGEILGIHQPRVSASMQSRGRLQHRRPMDFIGSRSSTWKSPIRPTRNEHGSVSLRL